MWNLLGIKIGFTNFDFSPSRWWVDPEFVLNVFINHTNQNKKRTNIFFNPIYKKNDHEEPTKW